MGPLGGRAPCFARREAAPSACAPRPIAAQRRAYAIRRIAPHGPKGRPTARSAAQKPCYRRRHVSVVLTLPDARQLAGKVSMR